MTTITKGCGPRTDEVTENIRHATSANELDMIIASMPANHLRLPILKALVSNKNSSPKVIDRVFSTAIERIFFDSPQWTDLAVLCIKHTNASDYVLKKSSRVSTCLGLALKEREDAISIRK